MERADKRDNDSEGVKECGRTGEGERSGDELVSVGKCEGDGEGDKPGVKRKGVGS